MTRERKYVNYDLEAFLICLWLFLFVTFVLIGIAIYSTFHDETIDAPGFSRDGRSFDFQDFAVQEELDDLEVTYLDGKVAWASLSAGPREIDQYDVYVDLKREMIYIYSPDEIEGDTLIAEISQKTDAYHSNDELPVVIGKNGETTSAWVLYELDFVISQLREGRVDAQYARNVLDTIPISELDTESPTPVPMSYTVPN